MEDVARQESKEGVVDRLLDETGDFVPAGDLVCAELRTALVRQPVWNVRSGDEPPARDEGLGAAGESLEGRSQRLRVILLRDGLPALGGPEPPLVGKAQHLLDEGPGGARILATTRQLATSRDVRQYTTPTGGGPRPSEPRDEEGVCG